MIYEQFVSAAKLRKQFDITSGTLRRWAEQGKIKFVRPNAESCGRGGRRLYSVNDIQSILGVNNNVTNKQTICYARVSSHHQEEDLQRQIQLLQNNFPNAKIIKDIGSGLNWNRHGFMSLLEQVHSGSVESVVVTYKDRLCRFGFELLEWIFQKTNVKLVVLNTSTDPNNISNELAEDLLAITTVFVAKNNGLRSAAFKKQRKDFQLQNQRGGGKVN